MQRGLLVWNARAGAQDDARCEQIVSLLGRSLDLEIHELEEGASATPAVREAIARGVEVIVAAGGDGTVSTCASAVLGTRAELAIVPCGTSNSFARALGLPTDVEGACEVIASGGPRWIDAARVGGHAMVLLASIGFHADTIESTTSESKSTLGKLAYVMRGLAHLGEFESFDARIETEHGSTDLRAMALTIANLAPPETLFAHGAPELVPDDGWLDLTLVSAETPLGALAAGMELVASTLVGAEATGPHVGWARCKKARIIAEPPQHVLVDGDVIGTTPVEIEIVPRGLAIRAPR
ncbi:YegS/Rv2252/BmrU family lipid kinase [Sandaracinus amylolyticus]|uniref:YegS/Rv2252/BmrU family lipid kinase n=1 Tax=Sandaracinus amylolyticus TaxID=927083 RepID=UPI001EFFF7D9|nr:YegS/Rv2252/BmrU family lipid kinase [Sandaracinus amylolyticus]UJR82028.1 Transcription regulator [Sandaracinus amylolyticus]